MSNQVWKDVVGYEGLYLVSDEGFVIGVKSKKKLRVSPTYNGYHRVKLYRNAQGKTMMVHRIVASAFIPNPENKDQVNHKDGNKANNALTNLEWVTQEENQKHAYLNGLSNIEPANNATRKKVIQRDMNGCVIKVWRSISEASRALGLQISNISHCCSNKIKSTGGYKWSFAI